MKRPRRKVIWVACPECSGEGIQSNLDGTDREKCWRCQGSGYVRFTSTKRVMMEFECTSNALRDYPRRYWLRVIDSLLGHIDKLENNRFQLVNQLDKEQKKNGIERVGREESY